MFNWAGPSGNLRQSTVLEAPRLQKKSADAENMAGCLKRLLISPAQPRCAETHPPAGKAPANEEARRTLRYVEVLSDVRTPLAGFFSILLEHNQIVLFKVQLVVRRHDDLR